MLAMQVGLGSFKGRQDGGAHEHWQRRRKIPLFSTRNDLVLS